MGALFAAEFLRLRRHAPWMDRALRVQATLGFLGAVAALFFDYAIAVRLGVVLVILWAPLLLLAGLIALLRGERAARYYLLAWVTFLAAAFFTAIYQFGVIPRAFVGEYSLLIGSALEALLLSFALGDRLNQLREAKDTAQREALRNLGRYQTLYERARYGIFTTSLDGRIIGGNPAFVEMLGYDSLPRMQREVADLERDLYLQPEDRRRMLAELDQRGQVHAFETRMRRRDGTPVWVAISAHRLGQGEDGHIEGSLLDITERKQREAAERARALAEKEKEAAKAAAQAKSSFLSNMSHEIRTPLTAVIGYGEYLLEPALDPARREQFARTIVRSGKHLLALLNDVLDLSKIEAERLRVECLPVSLFRQMADVQSVFEVRARERGLGFRLVYHWPLPETISTDPTRLRQILYNLCGNAMKFTERGGVTLEVRCQPETNRLSIAVVDTGIGIPAYKQRQIFQAFTQADVSTTRRHGGTGLGLTISRQLAERMGGELRCSSEPGLGSRFELELPTGDLEGVRLVHDVPHTPRAELADEQAVRVPQLRGSILHAEDNPDSRELVAMMVRRTGAEIVCVADGAEAVARAWERPYDLVLMDVQMPVLDGFGALAELRAQGFGAPVVALTANVMAEDRVRYHQAGFIACEPKPIRRESFYRLLARHLPAATAAGAALRGRVLLAGDNPDNQALIRWQLETLGAEVLVASDGEQALALAESGEIELVLLDLDMPVLDGATAARRLHARQPELPVYLLTATDAAEARRVAAECGCLGSLGKPLDAQALREVLARHLRAEACAPPSEPPTPPAQDYDDLSDLIQRFVDGLPETLRAMDSARAARDWAALRSLAHQLKGAGGSFGHPELSRLAAGLGKAVKAGDPSAVDQQLAALREAVARAGKG
ncbi:response regulator [Alkalilimnicola sp. S0819]|uniref:hybrid sensor histidine kinase/response regulator n=1 Tax=Alkalilimnicola sp. S0819 TaxID=2613922 RepID=UPI0021F81297|nr:response regulator [Alkalilimnicola sp. S0819]